MVPPHSSATAVKGGPNNDTLFLFGGFTVDQTMALVYTFDSRSIIWSIPKIAGVTFRKWDLTSIINKDGRMYLWSGETNTDYVNEMLILDTINLNWSKGSIINAPNPRINYGTGLILSEYDIINDNWDTKATSGKIPSNRAGFSAILGFFINPGYLDTTLYVLDLANYNWYIPKISGKILKPRVFHKANVIGKYMVISFGYSYDKTVESNIAGIVVGSLLSGILLTVGSFLIYKWNKNKLKTIHKNDKNNDYSQEEKELPIQETIQIDQIPRNESTSNYEPIIIPPPIINKNNYHEILQAVKNEIGQNLKNEFLQAVKNEIGQNLKNELLQAVREDNLNITRNNTKQD
ncbi:11103_t:CDS:2 [Rhizophagus irregularis]|nr:11103_t:CDS:2 [Rhizophagus irregularis]